jgi:hypothetical protein
MPAYTSVERCSTQITASVDLSAKQYYFCKVAATGTGTFSVAGERAIGVIQNKPVAGQAILLCDSGPTPIVAGAGGLAAGALVHSDANGAGVTSATSGHLILGVCLEAAAAGGLAMIMFHPNGANA